MINFATMGSTPKLIQSRTVQWLCISCLAKDPGFNLEKFNSPGMKSEPLERVRRALGVPHGGEASATSSTDDK